jgi:very-short-patch-repair endonuclease
MKEYYPIVKIPQSLIDVQNIVPLLPSKPKEPTKPELIMPKEPVKKEADKLGIWGILWLTLIAGSTIFYLFGEKTRNVFENMAGSFMISFVVISIYSFFRNSNEDDKADSDYIKAKLLYEKACTDAKKKYQIELSDYKTKIEKYKEAIANWDTVIKEKTSTDYINNLKVSSLNNWLCKYQVNRLVDDEWLPRRGVTEFEFEKILKEQLGANSVVSNQSLYSLFSNTIPLSYIPDFIITFENDLKVIIEIDEPYIGATGAPIHYIGCEDDNRDVSILNYHFVIIRFAEIQIVKYPLYCCNLISSIHKNISGFKIEQEVANSNIQKTKRWSKEEAHRMAFSRFRNSYLGVKLREDLLSEEIEKDFSKISIFVSKDKNSIEYDDLPF